MTDFESKCYGMSEADIREQYMKSITARHSGLEMVVMGILSDCQEFLVMDARYTFQKTDRSEAVRQQLNIAKFILGEMMDQRQAAELLADETKSNVYSEGYSEGYANAMDEVDSR